MEALIFDIDGTLWDSTELVAKGYNLQMEKEGYGRYAVTGAYLKTLFGKTAKEIADILFPHIPVPDRYALFARCEESENRLLRADPCRIGYPGVRQTMETLSKKYRLFIVSNSQSGYPQLVMEKMGLTPFLSCHLCHGDTGTHKGLTLQKLMQDHGIADAVYIGDTQGDRDASVFAGLPFVFCAYGFGQPDGWDYRIEQFSDLTEIF